MRRVACRGVVVATTISASSTCVLQRRRHVTATTAVPPSSTTTTTTTTATATAPRVPDMPSTRSALWAALHPDDKVAMLATLRQRSSRLLDDEADSTYDNNGDSDNSSSNNSNDVTSASRHHASLCRGLPYAARLQLALSAAMWLSALHRVEVTMTPQPQLPVPPPPRMSHGATRRVDAALWCTRVWPTRLSDCVVDGMTAVDVVLAHAVAHVPPPRTYEAVAALASDARAQRAMRGNDDNDDDSSSSSVDDDAAYDAVLAAAHSDGSAQRQRRGRLRRRVGHLLRRRNYASPVHADDTATTTAAAATATTRTRVLLQFVRDCVPRRGADDDWSATRAAQSGVSFAMRASSSSSSAAAAAAASTTTAAHDYRRDDVSATTTASATTTRLRSSSAVYLADDDAQRDAVYHGNATRAAGCPLDDSGRLTSTPIHIAMPRIAPTRRRDNDNNDDNDGGCSHGATRRGHDNVDDSNNCASSHTLLAARVRCCVMAHAAVLSSLFVEGRTACVTLDDALVYNYVCWLCAPLLQQRYLTVTLLPATRGSSSSSGNAEATTSSTSATAAALPSSSPPLLMPYYPDWSTYRSRPPVLLLVPPRMTHFTTQQARRLARAIVCCAPCIVLVHDDGDGSCCDADSSTCTRTTADAGALPLYVRQLQQEVSRQRAQQQQQRHDSAYVTWERVRVSSSSSSARSDARQPSSSSSSFVPRVHATATRQWHTRGRALLAAVSSCCQHVCLAVSAQWTRGDTATAAATDSNADAAHDAHARFLARVAADALYPFYLLHILYEPYNATITSRELHRYVWQQLPSNVRVVGINADPLSVLYYYPGATFLTHKIGNAARLRHVTRTVVRRDDTTVSDEPLRAALSWLVRPWRHWRDETTLSVDLCSLQGTRTKTTTTRLRAAMTHARMQPYSQHAQHALVWERVVDYLTAPGAYTFIALACAKLMRF